MAEIELSEGKTTSAANNSALKSGKTNGMGSNNVMKATENPLYQNGSDETDMEVHEEETQSKQHRPNKRGGRKTYKSMNVVFTQMTYCNIIGCRGLIVLLVMLSIAALHAAVAISQHYKCGGVKNRMQ